MMSKVKITKKQAEFVEKYRNNTETGVYDFLHDVAITKLTKESECSIEHQKTLKKITKAFVTGVYEVIEDRKREKNDVFKGDILWFNESVQEVVKVNDKYVYLDVIGKVTREIVRLTLEKNQTCFICYVEDRLDNAH